MLRKIDHLGVAVRSLDDAISFYRDALGLRLGGIEEVPSYRVRVAFFRVGDSKIELLEPTSAAGMIAEFIAAHGPGLHHVAYEVEDVAAAIRTCEARGVRMIDRAPRPGAHGARVAFVDPASSGSVVTELLEHARPGARRAP
ncbi:MAG TPA: methylmalonyl-CoA epimerase [Anaeromyxobacter sp.]|nr:methylmalonyl-CoA epimerase [Anaeromyxobacter sp.]